MTTFHFEKIGEKVAIREATKEDAALSLQVEEICMRDHATAIWGSWRPSSTEEDYDPNNQKIVTYNDSSAGIAAWELHPEYVVLSRIYLFPEFRGRGIGKMLLDHVKSESRGLPIKLSVLGPNTDAVRFYGREGFHVDSQTPERFLMSFDEASNEQSRTAS